MTTQRKNVSRQNWEVANSFFLLLQADIAHVALWAKEPEMHETPSLTDLITHWTKVSDLILELTVTPFSIPPEREEEYKQHYMYTVEYMKQNCNEINGMMAAVEQYRLELYISILNQQLQDALDKWTEQLNDYSKLDDFEKDDLFDERDYLEYLRIGLNIIRLDYPRLQGVDYDKFTAQLELLDQRFKQLINGKTTPLPDPRGFWWRK